MKTNLLLLGAATMAMAAASPPGFLTGQWGGVQTVLTLTDSGGTFKSSCETAIISGPVRLDARGRFRAQGAFEAFAPGPQQADAPAGQRKARFDGQVKGDVLRLTIHTDGPPRTVEMSRGVRSKIVRCL